MADHLYVSLQDDDRILHFVIDPDSGEIEPRDGISLDGGPAPLAIDPTRRSLYVGRRRGFLLSSLSIAPISAARPLRAAAAARYSVCTGPWFAESRLAPAAEPRARRRTGLSSSMRRGGRAVSRRCGAPLFPATKLTRIK